jgi:trehalose 6-phosphate phosphatase
LFLDFDGTLSEIVARPELAVLHPGAHPVLAALAALYDVVAVVSGRPATELERLVPVEGVARTGTYGLDGSHQVPAAGIPSEARAEAAALAGLVPGTRVEDKPSSVAVHYRGTPDPDEALRTLEPPLSSLAARLGLLLLRGKMVLELAPLATPGKGSVLLREAERRELAHVLYAGDDLADEDAFTAMDELRSRGVDTVKVAVRSEETPPSLLQRADVIVERPAGLVELLSLLT